MIGKLIGAYCFGTITFGSLYGGYKTYQSIKNQNTKFTICYISYDYTQIPTTNRDKFKIIMIGSIIGSLGAICFPYRFGEASIKAFNKNTKDK